MSKPKEPVTLREMIRAVKENISGVCYDPIDHKAHRLTRYIVVRKEIIKALSEWFLFKQGLEMDVNSRFFKNCSSCRKLDRKICQSCPFRPYIEAVESAAKKEK